MQSRIPLIFCFSFSGFVSAQTVYTPFASTMPEEGKEFTVSGEYFQTTSVTDKDGVVTVLDGTSKHIRYDVDILFKYGLTSQLEFFGGAKARMINSEFIYSGDSETYQLNRSGIESYFGGFKYSFEEVERLKYAIEGYYKNRTYNNSEYSVSDTPEVIALGEGSREYAIGMDAYYKTISNNIFDLQILYRSPSEFLSQEIYARAQFGLIWSYIALYAGVENVTSLGNDPYTDDPENKSKILQGSSVMYNSINRSWVAPYVGMNFALGKSWSMGGKYTQVTQGVSTDLGPKIAFHLTYRNANEKSEFKLRNSEFKQYRVEGVVTKVGKTRKIVVIDQGLNEGLEQGKRVDFYHFDFVEGDELIATGVLVKVGATKSMVKITKRYARKRVEEGTVVRAGQIYENLEN